MSTWPQVRVRYRRAHPWPCLRCVHFSTSLTVKHGTKEHGALNDECSVPNHHYILLASYDARDCDDFEPRPRGSNAKQR